MIASKADPPAVSNHVDESVLSINECDNRIRHESVKFLSPVKITFIQKALACQASWRQSDCLQTDHFGQGQHLLSQTNRLTIRQ
jgi:hypothetical protein